jgi:hypothetical protein
VNEPRCPRAPARSGDKSTKGRPPEGAALSATAR